MKSKLFEVFKNIAKPFTLSTSFSSLSNSILKCWYFSFFETGAIIPKLLNKKGIINIGGKTQSVYNFAKKYNKKIKKTSGKKILILFTEGFIIATVITGILYYLIKHIAS